MIEINGTVRPGYWPHARRKFVDTEKSKLLPKSPMAIAVGYTLNQWEELDAFLRDPELPIHSNLAERGSMRQALNRVNSLLVDNNRGDPVEPKELMPMA